MSKTLVQAPMTKVMCVKEFSIDAMFGAVGPTDHVDRIDPLVHNSRFRQFVLGSDTPAEFSFRPVTNTMPIEAIVDYAGSVMLEHERNCTLRTLYRVMKDNDLILERAIGQYIVIPEASHQGKPSIIVFEPLSAERPFWSMSTRQVHHRISGLKDFQVVIPLVSFLASVEYW
jgi:hypothetical protein